MDTSLLLLLLLFIVNDVYCQKVILRDKIFPITTKGYPATEPVSTETTPTTVFADSVQNLTVSDVTSSSFTVSWEPPIYGTGFFIDRYVVYINCSNATLGDYCVVDCSLITDTVDADQTVYTFKNATPFTVYEVTVLPEPNSGSWLPATISLRTHEDFPESPANVSIINTSPTGFTVVWDPPSCVNGILKNYVVTVEYIYEEEMNCQPPSEHYWRIPLDADVTKYSFTLGWPFSKYNVSVISVASGGNSSSYPQEARTLEDIPDSPANVSIINTSSMGFTVVWDPPPCVNGVLKNYVVTVEYIYEEEMNCQPPSEHYWSIPLDADVTKYSFTLGWPFSKYNVSVISVASGGNNSSYPQEAKTLEDIPDSPANVSIINTSSMGFTVTWDPPTCVNGELKNYVVTVEYIYEKEMNCQPPSEQYWNISLDADVTKYSFTLGWPFSKYNVSVTSVASGGNNSSYPQEAKTLEDIPGPPVDLSVSSGFIITWKQPTCTNGKLQMYYVTVTFLSRAEYSEDCPTEDIKRYSFNVLPNTTDYQFTEEEPYSIYEICVLAATNVGNGSDICNYTQSTATVLDGPRVLKVESLNATTANITWNTPCPITDEIVNFSGHIHGYRPGFETDTKYFEREPQLFYFTANDLKPEYRYSVVMYAYGKMKGEGKNSSANFQQPAGIPGVLKNVSKELRSSPLDTYDPTRQARISVPTYIFDSTNGNIMYYAIFIAPYAMDQNSTSGYLETPIRRSDCNVTWPKTSYWGDVAVNGVASSEYQATPDCWYPSATDGVFTFVLGTDKSCGSHKYCNGPLHPHTEYTFKVRAYTSHGYQDSYVVAFHTDSEVAVGLTLGLVFGFLMAGTVLFGFVMYRNGQISCSLASILNNNDTRDVCPRPIPLKNFAKHCELLLDIPGRLSSEFQLLSTLCVDINETNTFSVGRLPDNKRKNRYINILPFDANRVKLDIVDDDASSDYINASFIKGYSKNVEYIATQGPKEETVKDFWLMVYQYNVNIIVMVTQLEEQGKVKCHQYYPNLRETEKYGDISVRCTTELQFSIYTSRTIMLLKGQERKKIVHLHFREWPDFGCPATSDAMLQFCQIVRHQILLSTAGGLTLVHCSAGVGRTGTLIALDILLQHIRENKTVDIFGVVYNLRKQRTNMVQSEAQYAYIYKCVRDALAETAYPKRDKISTSSLEPICESAGPALNATAHDNPRRIKTNSNITENEYEL